MPASPDVPAAGTKSIPSSPSPPRIAAIDVYRGFVMLLMMGEVLNFCGVAERLPTNGFWAFLCNQQSHVDWVGCVLHDMIQPSFSFLVGVSLPFSIASRSARGQTRGQMTLHAFGRALTLILLGVLLRSTHSSQTNWTFEDTLSQIGLGYGFLFALGFRPVRDQWIALGVTLVGYWALFAAYPLPAPSFNYESVGVSAEWLKSHGLNGFAAHWQKNSNPAWAFDTWFLNLFSRPKVFTHNGGGYATLSFIPTLGTMILGLIAGGILQNKSEPGSKVRWFLIAGAVSLALGWILGATGICPVVKRIWTPSWTLFSGGWCFVFLAGFYAILDLANIRAWSLPLTVVGMNSIAAYCIAHLFDGFVAKNLKTHLGQDFFKLFGLPYEPLFHGTTILLVLWLMLYWMYRRKIFLRI